MIHDGNYNDEDDWADYPMCIAILDAFGLKDRLVHVDYNSIVQGNNPAYEKEMITSVMGAAEQYGISTDFLHNCRADPDAAVESLAEAINASSEDDPLYYLQAGPPDIPYRGILAAYPEKMRALLRHFDELLERRLRYPGDLWKVQGGCDPPWHPPHRSSGRCLSGCGTPTTRVWIGYGTHAVSPLLALAGTCVDKVHCLGTGRMREELVEQYGNPYPMETAVFKLEGTDVAAEATRSLFHLVHEFVRSIVEQRPPYVDAVTVPDFRA